jgi:hypothetical protein
MRVIPASILAKLRQTVHSRDRDADPRINLVMQRTKRYIEQGSEMQPIDLWQRPGLGPLAVAIRREDRLKGPQKIYLVYVENGVAHLAVSDYLKSIEQVQDWEYLYPIGPALDVAIEFDGRWQRTSPDAEVCFDSPALWTLVSFGEPYIFRILPNSSLVVQQGQGPTYELAPSGVTKVAALRGWKNTYLWNHDQGIICAYIRNGDLYYRNFANQGTDADPLPAIWDTERKVDELSPAEDVALFRTNDYRVGFLAERNGEIHWAITSRNWAVMALEPHTITAGIDVAVDLIPITYVNLYHEHTITAGITVAVQMLYGASYNAFTLAANDDNETVRATVEHLLTDPDPLEFVIIDENEDAFDCLDVEIDPLDPLTLILTVQDLNYANQSSEGAGDLTLKFLGSVTAKGEAGQSVDPFQITFTPTGLEFIALSPPEVEAMWNE